MWPQFTYDAGSFNNTGDYSNNIGSDNNYNSLNHNRLIGQSNSNAGNTTNSHNTTINLKVDHEGLQILQLLSPLEPQQRHQSVRTHRVDSVGTWVLETREFGQWCAAEDSVGQVFFCYGNPGVGKTYVR